MASSGMPWIKLYNEFLDDPKVGRLTPGQQLLFVKLLLVAGECDAEGLLSNGDDPLTFDDIAWRLRFDVDLLTEHWQALESAGLVETQDDGSLLIVKFAERQGRPQSEKREQWRQRQQRKRDGVTEEESVTRDTCVSHAPRVEESRGEERRNREEREHTTTDKERENTRGGVDPVSRKALESIGIQGQNLWEMLKHPRDLILGWCAYAEATEGLTNPAGFVISKLREGEEPPELRDDGDWYTQEEYEKHIAAGQAHDT